LRAIVPLISAFALFVHAALGCCAHHAHAQVDPGCGAQRGGLDRESKGDEVHGGHRSEQCHHHQDTAPDPQNDERCPAGNGCDGTRCLGIRAAKVVSIDLADGVFCELATTPHVGFCGQQRALSVWHKRDSFAPHVRRHLACCVLMV
jgi:hypothetical protein